MHLMQAYREGPDSICRLAPFQIADPSPSSKHAPVQRKIDAEAVIISFLYSSTYVGIIDRKDLKLTLYRFFKYVSV